MKLGLLTKHGVSYTAHVLSPYRFTLVIQFPKQFYLICYLRFEQYRAKRQAILQTENAFEGKYKRSDKIGNIRNISTVRAFCKMNHELKFRKIQFTQYNIKNNLVLTM